MNPIASQTSMSPIDVSSPSVKDMSTQPQTTPQVSDSQVVSRVLKASEVKSSDVTKYNQPTKDSIAKAAEQIQSFVQSMGRNLNFSVDQTTGYHVVRVVNPETNEVVRQLPSEEMLKIAQTMSQLNNVLVSQRA
jgi:flagellar protein FlaG